MALVDLVGDFLCTAMFIFGIAATNVWVRDVGPQICTSETEVLLTIGFRCEEAKVFSWIFISTFAWACLLPADSFNPWSLLASKVTVNKLLRFACQLASAAFTASVAQHVLGYDPRFSFPRVPRCDDLSPGTRCERSGLPVLGAQPATGAVLNEAIHTLALNLVLGLLMPVLAAALRPVVIATAVVVTLRSPWATTGPALNLAPAMAAATLHGDWEAFAWHWVGTYAGVAAARAILALFSSGVGKASTVCGPPRKKLE